MFTGRIIRGEGIAKTLGYPTANLDVIPKKIGIGDGVYAARVTLRRMVFDAALIVQQQRVQKVEVYLFGYSGPDFYGESLEVSPIQKVSEIEQMSSEELKQKIDKDIIAIKDVLTNGDTDLECA